MKISTAEIKKYIKKCAAQGKDYTPQDFSEYIRQNSDKEMTKGQLSGAIYQLTDTGDLIKIERGLYRQGKRHAQASEEAGSQTTFANSKFVSEIEKCLKNTAVELTRIVERADVLDMSREEFMLLGEVKRVKEELEQISNQYK